MVIIISILLSLDQLKSHDVLEFAGGDNCLKEYWQENSVYIEHDTFFETKLNEIFYSILKNFSHCGITVITNEEWEKIKKQANQCGSEKTKLAINEIDEWVKNIFKNKTCFTIYGM